MINLVCLSVHSNRKNSLLHPLQDQKSSSFFLNRRKETTIEKTHIFAIAKRIQSHPEACPSWMDAQLFAKQHFWNLHHTDRMWEDTTESKYHIVS